MGTTLTGTTPQDTYDSLIKVTDNGPLSGTAKYLSDGLGNDSALALSTGNIGIGTATPNRNLHILGSAGIGTVLKLEAGSGAVTYLQLAYNGATNAQSGYIGYDSSANMGLFTNDTERVRITSAGNVGIGTSNPQQKLHVAGVAANSYALLGTSTNWGAADTNRIKIGSTGDTFTLGCDLRANTNYAGTTETSLGLWVTNGSSTMVEVVRATQNGLTFNGDTAAANALDDYEEGTFTPAISFGGLSTGITYAFAGGTYTKVGRKVTLNGYIALSNKGSATGNARIENAPFTVLSGDSALSATTLWLNAVAYTGSYQAFFRSGTTYAELTELTEAGSISSLQNGDFSNNSEITFSVTYFV